MFEDFPKKRTELPEEFRKIYASHYKKNRGGKTLATSLSQKMESWLHKKVAGDCRDGKQRSTLEIGAGTLNQLQYENNAPYDIIEPFRTLFENSSELKKVRHVYNDIDDVEAGNRYDRITSIATFEHIEDLPKVVAKSCLLLNEGGTLRVSIPNEGTFLWTLSWKLTTGLEYRIKYGLDYGILMKYEHVNTADQIEEVLSYFYSKVKCSVFGISKGFAFYRFYECSAPKTDVAKRYLDTLKQTLPL
jgi:hypothetical protein